MEKEWEQEPDNLEFEFAGLHCMIKRHPEIGNLCGYVGVPSTHPAFGKHYDDKLLENIAVHGGLTFADSGEAMAKWENKEGERAYPYAKPELYYFGFDCAHYMDLCPGYAKYGLPNIGGASYKNVAYVTSECEVLVAHLLALAVEGAGVTDGE